ncbi:MAG: HAMP domain-containing histidine kinase [Bacteroidales bacterium]|nr:HAMP domain-containing histidine kinase [Bacteroidales bacterium]
MAKMTFDNTWNVVILDDDPYLFRYISLMTGLMVLDNRRLMLIPFNMIDGLAGKGGAENVHVVMVNAGRNGKMTGLLKQVLRDPVSEKYQVITYRVHQGETRQVSFEWHDRDNSRKEAAKRLSRLVAALVEHYYLQEYPDGMPPASVDEPLSVPPEADRPIQFGELTREKIFSILVHDLKAPVGNIRVLMDLMLDDPGTEGMKEMRDLLTSVRRSAASIHELIENFQFWARLSDIESGPAHQTVRVKSLVDENLQLLAGLADSKDIRIISDIPPDLVVDGDEYMLTTVLRNILTNAIKFTGRGGMINVSSRKSTDEVMISVKDNGVGMSEAEIEKLYHSSKPYTTRGTESETGSGLGFMLSREFIERNGGTIKIQSVKGSGSEVCFFLPLIPASS